VIGYALVMVAGLAGVVSLARPFIGVIAFAVLSLLNLQVAFPELGQTHASLYLGVMIAAGALVSRQQGGLRIGVPALFLAVLLAWLGFGTLFAPDRAVALSVFVSTAKRMLFALLLLFIIRDKRQLFAFLLALVACGCANAVISVIQNSRRVYDVIGQREVIIEGSGLYHDSNYFILALVPLIPIAYFLFFRRKTGRVVRAYSLFGGAAVAIMSLGIVSSYSRTGFLALVAVFAFIAIRERRRVMTYLIGIIFAVAAIIVLPHEYWEKVHGIVEHKDSSSIGRLMIMGEAIRLMLLNPVVGVGIGNLGEAIREDPRSPAAIRGINKAHNEYLQLGAEGGMVALSLFCAYLFVAIRSAGQAVRVSRDATVARVATGIWIALASTMVILLFLSAANSDVLWIVLILPFVVRQVAMNDNGKQGEVKVAAIQHAAGRGRVKVAVADVRSVAQCRLGSR